MIATARAAAARQGKLFRDVGISLATLNRRELIDADELRFLDALAATGEATTDDAVDDLSAKFDNGGKWRGSIPLRLAREGLIVRVGVVKSSRTLGIGAGWRSGRSETDRPWMLDASNCERCSPLWMRYETEPARRVASSSRSNLRSLTNRTE